jgi:hypothetical protein
VTVRSKLRTAIFTHEVARLPKERDCAAHYQVLSYENSYGPFV